jgi:hypothetical protein
MSQVWPLFGVSERLGRVRGMGRSEEVAVEPRTDIQTKWGRSVMPPAPGLAEPKGRQELAEHRVLVLYSDSLMAQGVEAMLRKLPSLETVAVDIDQPDAIEQARAAHPDVVVVDLTELRGPCQEIFLRLLDEFPTLRVVCLHPEGNVLDVFRKQRVYIHQAQDLIATLLDR